MSEIEKMYENCGIEPQYWCSYKDTWCPIRDIGKFNPKCAKTEVTKDCDARSHIAQLPKFTAEKQLNLIIFLANREIRISPTYISSGYYLNDFSKIKSSRNISTFADSLAQHINAIWQDLTKEEKEVVRGILRT